MILLLAVIGAVIYGVYRGNNSNNDERATTEEENRVESNQDIKEEIPKPAVSPAPQESQNGLVYPIAQFSERITLKPFGLYVSPENSPVEPERFTGYHTAADVEYQDITEDVPVFAIADCQVVLSRIASGYGGVFVISFDLNDERHSAIYGHIRPSSLPRVNNRYEKGSQLAFLGTGYSAETDGERKHLHFGVLADNGLDLRGYVQSEAELTGWIDPQTLF